MPEIITTEAPSSYPWIHCARVLSKDHILLNVELQKAKSHLLPAHVCIPLSERTNLEPRAAASTTIRPCVKNLVRDCVFVN